jgi:hypothetical protein
MLPSTLALQFLAALTFAPLVPQAPGLEDFDQAGSTWADTLFPAQLGLGGAFVREPLGAGLGAPDTDPPLPINQGGDKEGRYFEQTFAPTGAISTSLDVHCDVRIEGYVGIGFPDPFGGRSVGFLLRGGYTPWSTAYSATLNHNGGTTATLDLSFQCNGIITPSTVLASSQPITIDPFHENYRLTFTAVGNQLVAELARVFVSGGVVVEEPIDLLAAPGVQSQLVATDGRLVAGFVGVNAFARGGNSVFYDDVQVTDLGCGPGLAYCSGDGAGAACPCGNDTKTGEGCRSSIGVGARLGAQGTTSAAADDLRLAASQVPPGNVGIFFSGTAPADLPFGDGLRCVGGSLIRLPVLNSGSCGVFLQDGVIGLVAGASGDTRYFQGWFRDFGGPCGTKFNLTHGLQVTITP